jgi:SAM-dependent methyltransferase
VSALQRWRERVVAFRRERGEPDRRAWQRTVEWYELWVAENDYVAKVMPRLRPLIGKRSRVLEIGPGTGGFTVPLARLAGEVVAVEPSAAMRAALERNLAAAGRANVRLLGAPIEESLDAIHGPFDLALASYSLYNVLPIDRVLRRLTAEADSLLAIMGAAQSAGTAQAARDRSDWYGELYRRFRGRQPVSPPQVEFFAPVVTDMGLDARVETIVTSRNYVYADEESMVEQWMVRLRVEPARLAELRAALLPLAERRQGRIGIYGRRETALVWVRSGDEDVDSPPARRA